MNGNDCKTTYIDIDVDLLLCTVHGFAWCLPSLIKKYTALTTNMLKTLFFLA